MGFTKHIDNMRILIISKLVFWFSNKTSKGSRGKIHMPIQWTLTNRTVLPDRHFI